MIATPPPRGHAGAPVHLGELLSPQQFALRCAETIQKPELRGWAINLCLPDDLMRVMESPLLPIGSGMALFNSPNGARYPVVVLQAAAFQLRVMLTLADARTQEWFREAATSGISRLAIDINETNQLAVAFARCDARSSADVEVEIAQCVNLEGEVRAHDEFGLASKLTKPGGVRSMIPGYEVQTVRLHLAIPEVERLVETREVLQGSSVLH